LLNHMLQKHNHSPEETIDSLVQNAGAVFPSETPLEETLSSLTSGYALIVVENSKPVGILTKIDVLDYVAGKI
jgi:predicted transcriptional regulator